jgi:primosomal protein N'
MELKERRDFSMPPYTSLVKIEGGAADIQALTEKLASSDFECWSPDDEGGRRSAIWVRTKKLSHLRRTLEPFFHIKRGRLGYPSVTVWHE